jgi:hypothetical protein
LFDNRIPKQILEGSLGGRSPAQKPSNRWEDRVWNYVAILLDTKTYVQLRDVGVIGGRERGRPWPENGPKSHRKKTRKTTA